MRRHNHGFTLIEMVVVMIVVGAGLLGLATLLNDNVKGMVVGEDAQRSAQYVQECIERVLAIRRNIGFDSTSISSTTCDTQTLPTGFARTVSVGSTTTGTATSTCPNAVECKTVSVTVTKGNVSSDSTVMLVSY
jgi:prepilin-type N-terminal cleavage/methylation domain-containing protein